MAHLNERVLIEPMKEGALAELIVGVTRDALFGLALTVGTGGVLADLIDDHATLLLPASREEIEAALHSLKLARLLDGRSVLAWMQFEIAGLKPFPDALKHVFRLSSALSVKHGVVGVPGEPDAGQMPRHPEIERVMQEQIGQDRRHDATLRRALVARLKLPLPALCIGALSQRST